MGMVQGSHTLGHRTPSEWCPLFCGPRRVYKKRFTKVYDVELLHHVEQVLSAPDSVAVLTAAC